MPQYRFTCLKKAKKKQTNIKKKHKVDRCKVSRKINHGKWIAFFRDINMYLIQGKIGIYISVVITVLMN